MINMSDEELLKLLKKKLPNSLAFKTEGGIKGKTELSGSLEDFLDFVESIWKDGYRVGEDKGYCYQYD